MMHAIFELSMLYICGSLNISLHLLIEVHYSARDIQIELVETFVVVISAYVPTPAKYSSSTKESDFHHL